MKDIEADADILFASTHTLVGYNQEGRRDSQKFREWLERSQKKGRLYIIYDEVHHIGAEKTDNFFEKIFNDEKNRISGGSLG